MIVVNVIVVVVVTAAPPLKPSLVPQTNTRGHSQASNTLETCKIQTTHTLIL